MFTKRPGKPNLLAMAKLPGRPRSAASRAALLPLALFVAAALSSCMELDAELEIRADGTGLLALDYVLPDFAENLDTGGRARRYLPLPADRAGLEAIAAGIPGLRLDAWERAALEPGPSGVDRFRISAALSFDSPAAFAAFAASTGGEGMAEAAADGRGFDLVLSEGRSSMDGGFLAFLAAAFPEAACSFTVRLPSRGASNRGAFDAAGTTLSWSLPLQEILTARDTLDWSVRW